MPLVFERLQVGMNLQRAEAAREVLMLVARDFLIAKEQHRMLDERRSQFFKDLVADLSQVNSCDLGAQCAGDRIHRYMLVAVHRNSPRAKIQDGAVLHHRRGTKTYRIVNRERSTRCFRTLTFILSLTGRGDRKSQTRTNYLAADCSEDGDVQGSVRATRYW